MTKDDVLQAPQLNLKPTAHTYVTSLVPYSDGFMCQKENQLADITCDKLDCNTLDADELDCQDIILKKDGATDVVMLNSDGSFRIEKNGVIGDLECASVTTGNPNPVHIPNLSI